MKLKNKIEKKINKKYKIVTIERILYGGYN